MNSIKKCAIAVFKIRNSTTTTSKTYQISNTGSNLSIKKIETTLSQRQFLLFGHKISEKTKEIVNEKVSSGINPTFLGKGSSGTVYSWEVNGKKKVIKILTDNYSPAFSIVRKTHRLYQSCAAEAMKDKRPIGLAKPYKGAGLRNNTTEIMESSFYEWDLKKFIQARNEHTEEQGVALFHHILSGVYHTHAAGYAHVDIKPENIYFRTKNGELQGGLADYDDTINVAFQAGQTTEFSYTWTPKYTHANDRQYLSGSTALTNRELCATLIKHDCYATAISLKEYMPRIHFQNLWIKRQLEELLDEVITQPADQRMSSLEMLTRFEEIVASTSPLNRI